MLMNIIAWGPQVMVITIINKVNRQIVSLYCMKYAEDKEYAENNVLTIKTYSSLNMLSIQNGANRSF